MQTELVQISANGAEPVVLEEAKFWLRIEHGSDDMLISSLITAARQHAETFCKRSFTPGEVWQLTLDRFPLAVAGEDRWFNTPLSEMWGTASEYQKLRPADLAIEIPMAPVTAIASVTYVDVTGTTQTLSPSAYTLLQDDGAKPLIFPVYGTGWPATQLELGAIVITFTAGATPNELVKVAIKQILSHWYQNRQAVTQLNTIPQTLPMSAEALLQPFRIMSL